MRNQGIGSWAARRARMSPDRTAVIHEGREWTYERIHDRIAYLGPNHPSLLETLFAAGTLGAIFVPLNTRLAAPELAYILRDSGASVLVHSPTHAEIVSELRSLAEVPNV